GLSVPRLLGGQTTGELAQEALITAWIRLREWLHQDEETRRIATRIEGAATEWARLGRPSEVLLHPRQLEEAARVAPSDLSEEATRLLVASRRSARRRRLARLALLIAGPLLVVLAIGSARARSRSEITARVNEILSDARAELARGLAASKEFDLHAQRAYALYDLKLTKPSLPAAEGIARWDEADAEWQK